MARRPCSRSIPGHMTNTSCGWPRPELMRGVARMGWNLSNFELCWRRSQTRWGRSG
jgi:hypothetical protein